MQVIGWKFGACQFIDVKFWVYEPLIGPELKLNDPCKQN